MVRGGLLAKRGALFVAASLCLAADPPAGDGAVTVWSVDAGDTALEYQVPSLACPDEVTFRERTADLYDFVEPFVANGARAHSIVRIEVIVTQGGYRGVILVIDPATGARVRRSREEERASCDELVWILSHRMKLVISPRPTASPKAPAKDEKKTEEIQRRLDALEEATEDLRAIDKEQRAQIAALQRALDEKKKTKMELTYALSVGAFITANLTNNVGPGAWVGGELRSGPFSLGLEMRTVFPSAIASTEMPTYGVQDYDLSQYAGLLIPCGRYSYLFGCAVVGAGTQLLYDSNLPGGARSGLVPLLQLGGRAGVEIPFGDSAFAGRAWGEVLYSLPSTGIYYDDQKGGSYPALRPDVSGFFGLGLVMRFGKEGI